MAGGIQRPSGKGKVRWLVRKWALHLPVLLIY